MTIRRFNQIVQLGVHPKCAENKKEMSTVDVCATDKTAIPCVSP